MLTHKSNTVNRKIKSAWIKEAKSLEKTARSLFADIYKLTLTFPPSLASIADQMVRAADSVGANVYEKAGCQSRYFSPKVLCNGLHIARGELWENMAHLRNVEAVGEVPKETYEDLFSRMKSLNKALTQLINEVVPYAYN